MVDSALKIFGNLSGKDVLKKIIVPLFVVTVVFLVVRWLINNAPEKDLTDDIKVNTSDLSYPVVQYGLWAGSLYNAMNGSGTDENTIYSILNKLQCVADWNQLVKSYGTKVLKTLFVTTCTGTLMTCLESELREKEMNKVYEILGNIGVVA